VTADDDAFRFDPPDDWEAESSDSMGTDAPEAGASGLNWTIGVLAVLYVVWALMWVMGLAQTPPLSTGSGFDNTMYRVGEFLAYIASPLWFVGVVWLGTRWSHKTRTGVLLLGLIVLIPWPYVLPVVLT
jgi:hypothetical protein